MITITLWLTYVRLRIERKNVSNKIWYNKIVCHWMIDLWRLDTLRRQQVNIWSSITAVGTERDSAAMTEVLSFCWYTAVWRTWTSCFSKQVSVYVFILPIIFLWFHINSKLSITLSPLKLTTLVHSIVPPALEYLHLTHMCWHSFQMIAD